MIEKPSFFSSRLSAVVANILNADDAGVTLQPCIGESEKLLKTLNWHGIWPEQSRQYIGIHKTAAAAEIGVPVDMDDMGVSASLLAVHPEFSRVPRIETMVRTLENISKDFSDIAIHVVKFNDLHNMLQGNTQDIRIGGKVTYGVMITAKNHDDLNEFLDHLETRYKGNSPDSPTHKI